MDFFVVNVDETSVQNEYLVKKGYVIQMSAAERTAANCFYQRVDTSATRSHSTLVGIICADGASQKHLPQVFIPNCDRITKEELRQYIQTLQPPIEVWQGFHGWVNQDAMTQLLTRYRQIARQLHPGKQLVVIMDSASQHFSAKVLRHARNLNIILIMIPGKLTWLLQPLDVSVFRVFKDRIKTALLAKRMDSATGTISMEDRMVALNDAIHSTLVQTEWSNAFDKVGALGDFTQLRNSVKVYFPLGVDVPNEPLTDQQMEEVAGRHRLDLAVKFNSCPQRMLEQSQPRLESLEADVPESLLESAGPSLPAEIEHPSESGNIIQTRSGKRKRQ